jgi:hypothetical protein
MVSRRPIELAGLIQDLANLVGLVVFKESLRYDQTLQGGAVVN